MAKPTSDYTWATDANYAAGTDGWSGNATKVTPSVGQRAAGWEPERPMAAQLLNEQIGVISEHLDYVNGVFDGTVDTDGSTRVVNIPGSAFSPGHTSAGLTNWNVGRSESNDLESDRNSAEALLDIRPYVSDGATITTIEFLVTPGSIRAGAARVRAGLIGKSVTWGGTPVNPAEAIISSDWDNGTTAALQVISLTSVGHTADASRLDLLFIESGSDGATNLDYLHAARITYTDFRAAR